MPYWNDVPVLCYPMVRSNLMNLTLHPELQKFVDEQVSTGRFLTPEEVVNAALANLQTEQQLEDDLSPEELEELRAKIAVGIEQADRGELSAWDPNEVMA